MKTVVITGSTRGIGLGMAKEFLNRGHQVVISGTSDNSVSHGLASIDIMKDNTIGVPCLVQDPDAIQNLWNEGVKAFGKIDIWINSAGVSTSRNGLEDLDTDEILNIFTKAADIESLVVAFERDPSLSMAYPHRMLCSWAC